MNSKPDNVKQAGQVQAASDPKLGLNAEGATNCSFFFLLRSMHILRDTHIIRFTTTINNLVVADPGLRSVQECIGGPANIVGCPFELRDLWWPSLSHCKSSLQPLQPWTLQSAASAPFLTSPAMQEEANTPSLNHPR
eukprot:4957640-Amphidinium_carterae.1